LTIHLQFDRRFPLPNKHDPMPQKTHNPKHPKIWYTAQIHKNIWPNSPLNNSTIPRTFIKTMVCKTNLNRKILHRIKFKFRKIKYTIQISWLKMCSFIKIIKISILIVVSHYYNAVWSSLITNSHTFRFEWDSPVFRTSIPLFHEESSGH